MAMRKEDLEQIASLVFEKIQAAAPQKRSVAEAMKTLTARVPQEFIDLLDRIAKQTGRDRSEVLRDILRETAVKHAKK